VTSFDNLREAVAGHFRCDVAAGASGFFCAVTRMKRETSRWHQDYVLLVVYYLFGFDCRELDGREWDCLMQEYYTLLGKGDSLADAAAASFSWFKKILAK